MSELNSDGVQNSGGENTQSVNTPADTTSQGTQQPNTQTTNPTDGNVQTDPNAGDPNPQGEGQGGELDENGNPIDSKNPVPYNRFSEVIKEKNAEKAAKLAEKTAREAAEARVKELEEKYGVNKEQEQTKDKSSSGEQQQFKNVPDDVVEQLFDGLDLPPIPEDERDEQGNLVKPAFKSYADLINFIRRDNLKTMTLLREKDNSMKAQREKAAEDEANQVVANIQKGFGEDQDGFKQFQAWAQKEYDNGSKADVNELLRFFNTHVYKKTNQTQQPNTATEKVSIPNQTPKKGSSLPMDVISQTSWSDL